MSKQKMDIKKVAPAKFGIVIKNHSDTLMYFNNVINIIERYKHEEHYIYFDYSSVKEIYGCSVVYLVSIIHSLQLTDRIPRCVPPRNDYIKSKLDKVGCLLNNAHSTPTVSPKKDSDIILYMGEDFNPGELVNIIEHMTNSWKIDKTKVDFLYDLVGELILNAIEHAYKHKRHLKRMLQKWYLYISLENGKAKFFFLDNGVGIPMTVKKSKAEEFADIFYWIRNKVLKSREPKNLESEYIYSALQGGRRSKVKPENDDRGLKIVSNFHKDKKISKLEVFSNRGYCKLDKLNDSKNSPKLVKRSALPTLLHGTMFCWEIAI